MVVATSAPETITSWVESLKDQGIKYVRFELPDLHGVSRLKVIPLGQVERYARKGLNFYGGTLALDTASSVVPASGYHKERRYQDHLLFPDINSCTPVPWQDGTVMGERLGTEFCHLFTTVKQFELARFHDHITDWEVAEYLEVY